MIRRDVVYLGIIIILLGIVAVMTCQSPEPYDEEKETYKDSVKVLKSQKAFKAAQFDSVSSMANVLVREKDSIVAAKDSEISRLKVKASKAVEAIPVRVMEENPEIGYTIQAKDRVIQEQGILIDTLKNQLAFERGVRENLVALHYDQAKIENRMSELKDMRIIKLEGDLKKEKKKNKGLKIVAIGGTILGFLAGLKL